MVGSERAAAQVSPSDHNRRNDFIDQSRAIISDGGCMISYAVSPIPTERRRDGCRDGRMDGRTRRQCNAVH